MKDVLNTSNSVNRGQYECRTLWGEHERVFVLNIRSAGKKN